MPASSCTSNDSVPSSPTLVDVQRVAGPRQVEVVRRGLVVDLELAAAGRERRRPARRLARQADLGPGPDAALQRGSPPRRSTSRSSSSVPSASSSPPHPAAARMPTARSPASAKRDRSHRCLPSMARPHDTRRSATRFRAVVPGYDRRVDVGRSHPACGGGRGSTRSGRSRSARSTTRRRTASSSSTRRSRRRIRSVS